MNTPERNEKNVKKMQDLGKVYVDSEEDKEKERLQEEALKNATREYPLEILRRTAAVVCGGLWLFTVLGALFGVDFRAMLPFLFFSLSLFVFLNVPVFWIKKKTFDVAVGLICGLSSLILGLTLLR